MGGSYSAAVIPAPIAYIQVVTEQKLSARSASTILGAEEDDGWKDERQGIVLAERKPDGSVLLLLTNKAAGFVVGHKGACIRAVCQKTGAFSRSWISKDNTELPVSYNMPLRYCLIGGTDNAILHTILIMISAVERYKQLVFGLTQERVVSEDQVVEGIVFKYKPPPLNLMPNAARTYTPDYKAEYDRYMYSRQAFAAASAVPPPQFLPTPSPAPSMSHSSSTFITPREQGPSSANSLSQEVILQALEHRLALETSTQQMDVSNSQIDRLLSSYTQKEQQASLLAQRDSVYSFNERKQSPLRMDSASTVQRVDSARSDDRSSPKAENKDQESASHQTSYKTLTDQLEDLRVSISKMQKTKLFDMDIKQHNTESPENVSSQKSDGKQSPSSATATSPNNNATSNSVSPFVNTRSISQAQLLDLCAVILQSCNSEGSLAQAAEGVEDLPRPSSLPVLPEWEFSRSSTERSQESEEEVYRLPQNLLYFPKQSNLTISYNDTSKKVPNNPEQ
eukprot:TRINITY_DN3626_c0_g1_i13.p1 TRINITY_DN3626_c0_g1~~TRINITY_DN3626_c0_g1_i13.p1  ORF type:complete len:518 (+),score=54.25 TRINITY_DN3626_c0_g1_i13:31-1554(+)